MNHERAISVFEECIKYGIDFKKLAAINPVIRPLARRFVAVDPSMMDEEMDKIESVVTAYKQGVSKEVSSKTSMVDVYKQRYLMCIKANRYHINRKRANISKLPEIKESIRHLFVNERAMQKVLSKIKSGGRIDKNRVEIYNTIISKL